MPQMCKICTHPERAQIDLALGRGISGPQISKRHKVPIFSLYRHRKAHLSWELQAKLRAIGKPSEIDLEELRHTESEGLLQRVTWQRASCTSCSRSVSGLAILGTRRGCTVDCWRTSI